MPPEDRRSAFLTDLLAVIASGMLWLAVGFLNMKLMSATTVTTGIELVYLPAGFRLLIILIFGFWGALGIFLASPVLIVTLFGPASPLEIITNSAIAAFVPLVVVSLCSRLFGIDTSLVRLKAIHLPVLAAAVSIVTPVMFNVQFATFGRGSYEEILKNTSAMCLGDFMGCLIVIATARLAISAYRMAT